MKKMKYIIIVTILLMSAIWSQAQVYTGSAVSTNPSWKTKIDTVKSILLVCDLNTGGVPAMGYFSPLTQAQNDNRIPFWVRGYAIRKVLSWDGSAVYGYSDNYLDEYKKAFPKNIIVWQSKDEQ